MAKTRRTSSSRSRRSPPPRRLMWCKRCGCGGYVEAREKRPAWCTCPGHRADLETRPAERLERERLDGIEQLEYGIAHRLRERVAVAGMPLVQDIYDWFGEFNAFHFGSKLPTATLLLASTSSPRAFGDHCKMDEHGIRYRIRLSPAAARRGEIFLRDVLLHELVHVAVAHFDDDEEKGYRGHGPKFAARCNAIGKVLGLPRVAARDRAKGKRHAPREPLPDCAQWPVNVRPEGYYPEAVEASVRARRPKDDDEPSSSRRVRTDDENAPAGISRASLRAVNERIDELETAIRVAIELLDGEKDFAAQSAVGELRAALDGQGEAE